MTRHKRTFKSYELVVENLDSLSFQSEVNSKLGGIASKLQC